MDWHRNLEDRMRELHVHGLSIAVFEHYHLAWAKGFGVEDVDKVMVVGLTRRRWELTSFRFLPGSSHWEDVRRGPA